MLQFMMMILFLFPQVNSQSNEMSLTEIREGYFHSSFGKDKIAGFHGQLLKVKNRTPVLVGYHAAATAIMTRTTWNWFRKLDYLKESRKLFIQAVEKDPKNVEIRFLRITVEDRIPFYLGYSDHMDEDKEIIMKYLDTYDSQSVNPEILKFLHKRLQESEKFSEEELKTIKQKMVNLN